MAKNYAYESGAFMALAQMMRDQIQRLDSEDEIVREWAVDSLKALAAQTTDTLAQFGYTTQGADQ